MTYGTDSDDDIWDYKSSSVSNNRTNGVRSKLIEILFIFYTFT